MGCAATAKERTEGPTKETSAPALALEVDAPACGKRGGAEDGDGDGCVDASVVDPGVGVADGGVGGGGRGEGGFGVLDSAEFVGKVGERVRGGGSKGTAGVGAGVLRSGGHS